MPTLLALERLQHASRKGNTMMASNEAKWLIKIEQRLLPRLRGQPPAVRSLSDSHPRDSRLRSDFARRQSQQLVHCLRWLGQQEIA
jgi:hypothetical protein